MVFPSVEFLFFFFPIFLLIYALLPFKNVTILFFSLLFYTWGEGVYIALLLVTVFLNFIVAKQIHKVKAENAIRILFLGVSLNLIILLYYKYFGFFVGSILNLEAPVGGFPHLPLGISFFIFQSISYLIDVYRKDAPPADSFFDVALYISMFPQLVAGPIVRYSFVAEAIKNRHVSYSQFRDGIFLFVGGMCAKVLIANNAAEIADTAFSLPIETINAPVAWLGSLAYTIQIFFDFSGYSTMAIGIGLVMGFRFPINFNYPYISTSITEFWRRWHMSLSSWFRDYLYIPLGGNKKGFIRTYINLFAVFFLCGLWHGAAWTFLIWGVFHGLLLVIERLGLKAFLDKCPRIISHLYTLLMVIIGWIVFRAENFDQALVFIGSLFKFQNVTIPSELIRVLNNENILFSLLGVFLSLPLLPRLLTLMNILPSLDTHQSLTVKQNSLVVLLAIIGMLVCSVYVISGTYSPFIYFRF